MRHGLHQSPMKQPVKSPRHSKAIETNHGPKHSDSRLEAARTKEYPSYDNGKESERHTGEVTPLGPRRILNRVTKGLAQSVPSVIDRQKYPMQSAPEYEGP